MRHHAVGLPSTELLERSKKILDVPSESIDLSDVNASIPDNYFDARLECVPVDGEDCYFEGSVHAMEIRIATRLCQIKQVGRRGRPCIPCCTMTGVFSAQGASCSEYVFE